MAERAAPRRGRDEHPMEREERQAAHHPSWAGAQKATMARLRDIGMSYEDANKWLAEHGRPRLSGMDPETREKALSYFGRPRDSAPAAR